MDNFLRSLYQERASQPSTLGIIFIEKKDHHFYLTDTFDCILLIITSETHMEFFSKHYVYDNEKIALYIFPHHRLEKWLLTGTNPQIVGWLYEGKIIFDRNDYISQLIQNLKDFPFHERKIRIGLEFAKLIKRYNEGKMLYEEGEFLDAHSQIIKSLHYLGRLALIEKGYHPEIIVWNQVKRIDPDVYKIYEELINSEEPLNKRLELLFLAIEFFIHSRTEIGVSHILEVLNEQKYWTIQQICEHPEIELYGTNIFTLVEYLIEKGYICVTLEESKGKGIFHRYYKKVTDLN
ncbi:nucleotidyltransferase-like protein [Fervidibacillus halotolerans]|uniref:Nucleotidyltransferase-like protein n=1 Tax=Fervidibacillus halotolerans TaxID=2980027 RepID=A0A9E8LZZ8_9BACI|nr:nucleotidyltransferase-like protein [Fervidibacillus halotolerans]WAA12943.1 nucleotidyltransferase-like protein [Fervidibacillus halotolerans]